MTICWFQDATVILFYWQITAAVFKFEVERKFWVQKAPQGEKNILLHLPYINHFDTCEK